jgi:hypothetical protein
MQVCTLLAGCRTFSCVGCSERRAGSRGGFAEERTREQLGVRERTVYSAAVALAGHEYAYQSELRIRLGTSSLACPSL